MIYKRKYNKKTNYKKRLSYLLSRKPRLVIRKSNKVIYVQIVNYFSGGDKTIVSATSRELAKFGYKGTIKNIPSAYLTGLLIAKKTKKNEVSEVVVDIGFHKKTKGSLFFALIKGAQEGGLTMEINESILPDKKRIHGEHIAEFAQKRKASLELVNLPKNIEEVKKKLLEK